MYKVNDSKIYFIVFRKFKITLDSQQTLGIKNMYLLIFCTISSKTSAYH